MSTGSRPGLRNACLALCASDAVCPFINKTWPPPPPRRCQGHATADAGPWLERAALRVLAACLRAARPALRHCDWPRSTEPKGSSASRGLFDDMLPAASCIHSTVVRGCSSAEARAEGAVQGAAVQQCSSAVTAATAVRRRRWADKQGGDGTDRETGLLHAIAIWRCPHAVTLTLTTRHTAHGIQHGIRYGWTRYQVVSTARCSLLHRAQNTQCCVPHDPTGLAWTLYPSRRDGVPGSQVQR